MDALSTIALGAGLGWASGLRLYGVLFCLGALHYFGIVSLPLHLEVVAHPVVMAVSGAMFLIEFGADKIPGFDSVWDVLINASPEPFSNWTASFTEDALAAGAVWLSLKYPLLMLAVLLVLVALMIWLLPRLWRGVRRGVATALQLLRGTRSARP